MNNLERECKGIVVRKAYTVKHRESVFMGMVSFLLPMLLIVIIIVALTIK